MIRMNVPLMVVIRTLGGVRVLLIVMILMLALMKIVILKVDVFIWLMH